MKKIVIALLFFISLNPAAAQQTTPCDTWPSRLQSLCRHFHQIWTEGDNELYLSGYAWHNRYTYTRKKIKTYNERAWGGGLGKGRYDEKGNWHGIFAFAFQDSHKHMEPTAGYAFLNIAHLNKNTRCTILIDVYLPIHNTWPLA